MQLPVTVSYTVLCCVYRFAVTVELLTALSALHASGMVHGDLKPNNILLTHPHGERGGNQSSHSFSIKLADLGYALATGNRLAGQWGTSFYMAPEHFLNRNGHRSVLVHPNTDTWGLAVVLVESIIGFSLTYVFDSDRELSDIHRSGSFFEHLSIYLSQVELEEKWLDLLRMCFSYNQELRPSAEALLEHITTHPAWRQECQGAFVEAEAPAEPALMVRSFLK